MMSSERHEGAKERKFQPQSQLPACQSMRCYFHEGAVTCLGVHAIVHQAALPLPLQVVIPQVAGEAPARIWGRVIWWAG